jgi:hypothetical protein
MKTKETTMMVIAAIVIAAASFYGGMKYQESQRTAFLRNNFGSMMGQNNQRIGGTANGGMMRTNRGRPVIGEIISMDTDSITIKQQDGSSKIVLTTDKTIFNKTAAVQKDEVRVGEQIGVFGIENSDGSYTAQNVQLNPQFRMR